MGIGPRLKGIPNKSWNFLSLYTASQHLYAHQCFPLVLGGKLLDSTLPSLPAIQSLQIDNLNTVVLVASCSGCLC